MLISLCIPCHNRTHDLKKIFPYILEAAGKSPPVEVAVVDYNSPDDLYTFMRWMIQSPLPDGISITYRKYTGRNYYHMAHARNLAFKLSSGDYVITTSTDLYPKNNFFPLLREMISDGYVWMRDPILKGIIAVKRQEFIDVGGYDERIEFYGSDDRDMDARLTRKGGKFSEWYNGLWDVFETPNEIKVQNYRLQLSKAEMVRSSRKILQENNETSTIVANEGKEWGSWI